MKKVLIFSFLISTILISFFSTSYAAVVVTKENLTKAFKDFMASEFNEDNYKFSVEDSVINITEGNENYVLNYNLTGKPIFSFEVDIEKGMSYENFQNKYDNLTLPMYGYIAVANIQGVPFNDAITYFSFSYLESAMGFASSENSYSIYDDTNAAEGVTLERDENSKTILVSEFGDRVMEYVNSLYPETQTISDSGDANSYVMTIEKKELTETSCKLVSTLTVNTDADFSKLNGTMNNFEDSFMGNTITKENADYLITLKVGQKCKINTNSKINGYSSSGTGELEFSDDYTEITATKTGTKKLYLNIGDSQIQKSLYITIEENVENDKLDTITLKIDDTNTLDTKPNDTTTNNTSISLQESANKVTNSTNKLPQTGNFLSLQTLLILSIVICGIALISNLKYKNINIK